MPNRLQFEQSPYLLQHRENPVDWRPWGSEAFQTAREEDKPVFLSIGYSTCHWCHVMAHESFEDETVAEAINRDFIPIKVDREERPDVDAVYMAACVAMTGSGGWPLTVLLTPEQKPFWAGTYLPRQALLSLLQQAARLWREDRGSLLTAGEALTDRLREAEGAGTGFPDRALAGMAVGLYARSFDTRWGGFARYDRKTVDAYCRSHNRDIAFHCYVQYHLHTQLSEVCAYARAHGIVLKGDLPIGISRTSVDAWLYPHLFHMDSQAGAPPDAFSAVGQNWGFPTYNWERMARDGYA